MTCTRCNQPLPTLTNGQHYWHNKGGERLCPEGCVADDDLIDPARGVPPTTNEE